MIEDLRSELDGLRTALDRIQDGDMTAEEDERRVVLRQQADALQAIFVRLQSTQKSLGRELADCAEQVRDAHETLLAVSEHARASMLASTPTAASLYRAPASPGHGDDEDDEAGASSGKAVGTAKEAASVLGKDSRLRRLFSEVSFRVRPSLLTRMLATGEDYRTLYHIMVAVFMWLGINVIVTEWFRSGRLVNWDMLTWSFGRVEVVLPTWWLLFCLSFAVVPLVQLVNAWNLSRRAWLPLYVLLQVAMYSIGTYVVVSQTHALPPPSGMIIMCEMTRFSMKMHSYFREKLLYGMGPNPYRTFIPAWAVREGVTEEHLARPEIALGDLQEEIGRYIYFLFAPTLIYRDEYPRSGPYVRWLTAFQHLAHMFLVIGFTYLIFVTFCSPLFEQTAIQPGDAQTFVLSVFRSMAPGMLVLILMFFGVLHSWFNFFGELLCFGDRSHFYDSWWTARDFGQFYRRWNNVVGAWLRSYVYLDSVRFSLGSISRTQAHLLVFVISAIVHEHVIACALGFFFPILLLMFGGPGVFFVRLTRTNNIFLWGMLFIGTGLLLVLYAREWYARYGLEPLDVSALDPFYSTFLGRLAPRSALAYIFAKPSA